MVYNKRRGFTFIEAITVIIIITILASAAAVLFFDFIKNSVFLPNKLNIEMLAKDALDIMVEGDSNAKGLRFSKAITNAQSNRVDFVNQDNQTVYYRWDTGTNKLYRSISSGPEQNLPYYSAPSGISIAGKSGVMFSYYDINEIATSVPINVRRIKITLVAKTGSGSYSDWQGQSEQSSSVAVKKFQ
jgi:prepilin-type N-terminal cleavage/methylation domain-containing protein